MWLWNIAQGLLYAGVVFYQNPYGNRDCPNGECDSHLERNMRFTSRDFNAYDRKVNIQTFSESVDENNVRRRHNHRTRDLVVNHLGDSFTDMIAEELQEQMDKINKKLKNLQSEASGAKSKDQLNNIERKYADLYEKLEECYKHVDQLNQSQKQEWRQRLDQIQTSMISAQNALSNRLQTLEDKIERSNYQSVVGSIREGFINSAASTFKVLSYPKIVINGIVTEAFKGQVGQCQHILEFIDGISDNEFQGLALTTLYDRLSTSGDMYTETGSDCVFQLAWRAKELAKYALGQTTAMYYSLSVQLPIPVRKWVYGGRVQIQKGREECKFSSMDDGRQYLKNHLGDRNEWIVRSWKQTGGGKYFTLKDNLRQSYALESDGGKPFTKYNDEWPNMRKESQLWKPILTNNYQIYLQHKTSGKYLSYENLSSCYEYTLSSSKTPWYLH